MPPSILFFRHTAADDAAHMISIGEPDQWLEFADIFVYDENALFGGVDAQDVSILAGDSYNIPHPVNISDLFFRNAGAGANTRVVVVGTPYRGE